MIPFGPKPPKTAPDNSRVGLIAGSGQFPLLFAHAAVQAGVHVIAVGFEGETDAALAKYVDEFHLLKLGQLNRLIRTLKNAGVTRAAMAGAINKTRLYTRIRPDWRAVKFLNKLRNKKDDHLLRALAEELELEGIRIEPSTLFLPQLLAPEGILTRRKPNRLEHIDIEFGWGLAKAFGNLDIGQCLVVKNQAVLAVEGIDGTDATILRGGRLCRQGAVVVKVAKAIQDMRFDVPAVGYDTIETMKRVGGRVLVIEAGRTLVFDREKMIDAADAAGITILGRREDAGTGPTADTEVIPVPFGAACEAPPLAFAMGLGPLLSSSSSSTASTVRPAPAPALIIRPPKAQAMRVAVVGVGYLGRFHAQKYARLPEADLVAVVDVDRNRSEAVAQEVQTRALQDYRELFGQVDAVSVVTPTMHHYEIARAFLDAGVHVLLEKPMTQTIEEADHLVALAEERGLVLQIGHLERFNSAFQAIYPRLRNPMFVEAQRLALFNERGLEVDVILDLMIHDIDIVLHIVQSPLREIRASGIPVLTSLPDIATVRLTFENGAVANLTASRISLKNLRKIRIFQGNCYVSADYAEKRAYAVYKEDEPDEAGYPQLSVEEFPIEGRDALEEEIASFLTAISQNGPPIVGGHDGRRALAVALDISRQIEEDMQAPWTRARTLQLSR